MESTGVNREAVIKSLLTDSNTDGQPRKRRRLDNLTAEERALRRKLKNRVAAQTARDRKKARMTELEEQVEDLERQNRLLQEQNKRLQKQSTSLTTENADLRIRLGVTPPGSPDTQTEPLSPLSSAPSPSGSEDSECSVVIKEETEYEEYAAGTPDSVSFDDHDISDSEFKPDVFLDLSEHVEPEETFSLLQPKQEDEQLISCCEKVASGTPLSSTGGLKRKRDGEAFKDLEEMVGQASEQLESLDELLNCKDINNELKDLDFEQGTVGPDMWWEESFPELFPSLLAV